MQATLQYYPELPRKYGLWPSCTASRLGEEVRDLWVAHEVGGEERAARGDLEAARTGVGEDELDEGGGNPAATELGRDLGVEGDEASSDAAVVDPVTSWSPMRASYRRTAGSFVMAMSSLVT